MTLYLQNYTAQKDITRAGLLWSKWKTKSSSKLTYIFKSSEKSKHFCQAPPKPNLIDFFLVFLVHSDLFVPLVPFALFLLKFFPFVGFCFPRLSLSELEFLVLISFQFPTFFSASLIFLKGGEVLIFSSFGVSTITALHPWKHRNDKSNWLQALKIHKTKSQAGQVRPPGTPLGMMLTWYWFHNQVLARVEQLENTCTDCVNYPILKLGFGKFEHQTNSQPFPY